MAVAHWTLKETKAAIGVLKEALKLGRTEGYRRSFLNEGEPVAALLRAMLPDEHDEALTVYMNSLLHDFQSPKSGPIVAIPPGTSTTSPLNTLVEPLSQQEQRVLRLFAAGLSREEIAGELIVSVNTVKTHLQRVYRKLNVTSRAEARETAKQLNLL